MASKSKKGSSNTLQKPDCFVGVELDSALQNNATCKGIALIVTNNYEGTKHKKLPSTDLDSEMMENFFTMLGNYKVVVPKKNLKADEFKHICEYLAILPYPKVYRRIIIYIAGHGGDGFVTFQDKDVYLKDIQAIFNPGEQESLTKITRIFFIDACRVSSSHARSVSDAQKGFSCKHENELIAYSTLTGYVASDDKDGGGLWTNALLKCLMLQKDMHLCDVLSCVNEWLKSPDHDQISAYESSLSREEMIYFWKESGNYLAVTKHLSVW